MKPRLHHPVRVMTGYRDPRTMRRGDPRRGSAAGARRTASGRVKGRRRTGMAVTAAGQPRRRLPIFEGLLPIDPARVPTELIAGATLAALAIPETMGYTKIAGMPVDHGPLHDPDPDPVLRDLRLVAPPRGGRRLGDGRRPGRRARWGWARRPVAGVRRARRPGGPHVRRLADRRAHPAPRLHRQLPVAQRPHRLPDRRRHPGRDGSAGGHARRERRHGHDAREVRHHPQEHP